MGEEADVLKFLRRRTKDLTMTPGFWNFLITLVTIVALIFYFGGAPNTKNFRQREKVVGQWAYSLVLDDHLGLDPKVSIRKVMDAAIQMAILGGKEVVRVRYLSFVISHFFLIFLFHHFTSVLCSKESISSNKKPTSPGARLTWGSEVRDRHWREPMTL